ncbi:unnamed protein product [Amoebophrya sp. A25]|nr:unnamed protein product [Amoebophrya sp. A25]|eukprot:GSA25T00020308001.1
MTTAASPPSTCKDPFDGSVNMLFMHTFTSCVKESSLSVKLKFSSSQHHGNAEMKLATPFELSDPLGRSYWTSAFNLVGKTFVPVHWQRASWSWQVPQLASAHDHWLLMNGRPLVYWECLGPTILETQETDQGNEVETSDEDEENEQDEADLLELLGRRRNGRDEEQSPASHNLDLGPLHLVSRYAVSFDGHVSAEKGVFTRTSRKRNFPISVVNLLVRTHTFLQCPSKLCGSLRPVVWGSEEDQGESSTSRSFCTDEGASSTSTSSPSTTPTVSSGVLGGYTSSEPDDRVDHAVSSGVLGGYTSPESDHRREVVKARPSSDTAERSLPSLKDRMKNAVAKRISDCWTQRLTPPARHDYARMDTARNALFWSLLWLCSTAVGGLRGSGGLRGTNFSESLLSKEGLSDPADGVLVEQHRSKNGGSYNKCLSSSWVSTLSSLQESSLVLEKERHAINIVAEGIERCWVSAGLSRRLELAEKPDEMTMEWMPKCLGFIHLDE